MSFLFDGVSVGTTTFRAIKPNEYYADGTTLSGPQHTLRTTGGSRRTPRSGGTYLFTAYTISKDVSIPGSDPVQYGQIEVRVEIKAAEGIATSEVDAVLDQVALLTDGGRLEAMLRGAS